MRTFLLLGAAAACTAEVYFKETFDTMDSWVVSTKKEGLGKFVLDSGKFQGDKAINQGLKTSEDAKFYGISSKMTKPFDNKGKTLVVSFSTKHEQGIDCGGGYIKVMPELDLKAFDGDSSYFMMFGPDICGSTKKIHLIFGYKGENLLWKKTPAALTDKLTHVYTVVVKPDGQYEVQVDGEKKESGSLEEDWSFLKPKEIDDPEDKKPADWVEEAMIDDPEDKKPEDWGTEPEKLVDETASKPDDWDDEDDGEWEAPMIPNPAFKGEWKAKRISNPAYKGVFEPKKIANPEYVADSTLYLAPKPLAAVGIDVWQVKSGTIFDSIIISDSEEEVKEFVEATYGKTKDAEKAAEEVLTKAADDEAAKKAEEAKAATAEDEEDEDEHDEE